jgi:hypothetical protein
MKVIDEGKGDWRPWWLGQRMTCRECGRVVELELKDDQRRNWMPSSDDRVTIACERCGNMVRLDRETLPNAGAVPRRGSDVGTSLLLGVSE